MTTFDLNKALAGEPVICRDGTPATSFLYEPVPNSSGERHRLDYTFKSHVHGHAWTYYCTRDGVTSGTDGEKDLVMEDSQ